MAQLASAAGKRFNTAINPVIPGQTRDTALYFGGGQMVGTFATLDLSGAQKKTVFNINGVVKIEDIILTFTTVTDCTTLSGVKFSAWDGVAGADLCAATDLSGSIVGTSAIKAGNMAAQLSIIPADQIRVTDSDFVPCLIQEKPGGSNILQLAYTGDANTDVQVNIVVRYKGLAPNSSIVAA